MVLFNFIFKGNLQLICMFIVEEIIVQSSYIKEGEFILLNLDII